ncbi:2-aminoethylphosphonate--pyruvate transaminase 1 [Komagataeibacter swingsii DSM 16373]|nr:2-aminoethylphosphonate--pyruvate transaminase 1 [Komagataeibacter swingsii DSM 16373]
MSIPNQASGDMSDTIERASLDPHDLRAEPDHYLLTPGPLTTAPRTRAAMMRDWGSWDQEFRDLTAELRRTVLEIAGNATDYDCIPMQGSGTFCVEAMLGSFVPHDGKVLVLANGAYGQRIARTLGYLGRACRVLDKGDFSPPRGPEVARILAEDTAITHVIVVHCETSSGILNPIEEIAAVTAAHGRRFLIDSMSAFGAVNLDIATLQYEAMVSSANKCIEGVPGFGFIIARKTAFEQAKGRSHSLSLDLHEQWRTMNTTGQWRFTPPTHVVAAFVEALRLYMAQGGQPARLARYTANRDTLVAGMKALGFETLLEEQWLSPIIVTFLTPGHELFDFRNFYDLMKEKGFIIYPGKLTRVDSFRIGCIGHFGPDVMQRVISAAQESLAVLGVPHAAPSTASLAARDAAALA